MTTQVIGQHRFVLEGGKTAALLMTTAGVYDVSNRRFLAFDEVIGGLGHRAAASAERGRKRSSWPRIGRLRELAKQG